MLIKADNRSRKDWLMCPKVHRDRRNVTSVCSRFLLLSVASLLWTCDSPDSALLPADPRVILQAHLSHGVGESLFDSPLVHDSLAAAMVVHARECAPADALWGLAEDTADGGRLLEQLRSDGLITIREGQACATFPILLAEEQATYARVTHDVAEEALEVLSTDLVALTGLLDERGWREWQYHFVWSQLFDSQFAWTEMMQRSLVPPLDHVLAWAIYPDHPYRSGTNYYPDSELRDHWLIVTWRPEAANTLGLIGASWEIIYGAALEGRSMSREEQTRFADLGLVDDTGQLRIPILRSGDPLHDLLKSVAVRYIAFLEQRVPLDSLVALTGVDRQYTFAMVYHDISWGIVGELVGSGRIDVPAALKRGESQGEPSMRGVAAVTPVYAPFADLIRAAIESQQ
jgi:hypothetical protein